MISSLLLLGSKVNKISESFVIRSVPPVGTMPRRSSGPPLDREGRVFAQAIPQMVVDWRRAEIAIERGYARSLLVDDIPDAGIILIGGHRKETEHTPFDFAQGQPPGASRPTWP